MGFPGAFVVAELGDAGVGARHGEAVERSPSSRGREIELLHRWRRRDQCEWGFLGLKMSFFSCSGNWVAGKTGKGSSFFTGFDDVLLRTKSRCDSRFVSGHAGRDGVRENREGDGCELRFG